MDTLMLRRRAGMRIADNGGFPHAFVIGSGDAEHIDAIAADTVEITFLNRLVLWGVTVSPNIELHSGDVLYITVTLLQGSDFSGRFTFGLTGAEITNRTITQWTQLSYTKELAADVACPTFRIMKENTGNFRPGTPVRLKISIYVNGTQIL